MTRVIDDATRISRGSCSSRWPLVDGTSVRRSRCHGRGPGRITMVGRGLDVSTRACRARERPPDKACTAPGVIGGPPRGVDAKVESPARAGQKYRLSHSGLVDRCPLAPASSAISAPTAKPLPRSRGGDSNKLNKPPSPLASSDEACRGRCDSFKPPASSCLGRPFPLTATWAAAGATQASNGGRRPSLSRSLSVWTLGAGRTSHSTTRNRPRLATAATPSTAPKRPNSLSLSFPPALHHRHPHRHHFPRLITLLHLHASTHARSFAPPRLGPLGQRETSICPLICASPINCQSGPLPVVVVVATAV